MQEETTTRKRVEPTPGEGKGIVARSKLPQLLASIDPGPWGTTATNIAILDEIASAVDLALEAHEGMIYSVSDPAKDGEASLEPLSAEQRALAGLFAVRVMCLALTRRLPRIVEPPEVEGTLAREGIEDLARAECRDIAKRVLAMAGAYLQQARERPRAERIDSGAASGRCLYAFASLLMATVDDVSRTGRLARLREAVSNERIHVGTETWRGFTPGGLVAEDGGEKLRPVGPDDIVGNREYLEACLRLARDVAGFDMERGKNPKKLSPILFALGRPGCGKTLVAHAVGNYFMRYCGERGVQARFTVIRRTDWASSYQNASASNLVRIFREIHSFEGLTGLYWADIDTALASRDDKSMRGEEKANLSAAFNIFDGTLVPMDGRWFMICDANNLDMDEALRSRISQSPWFVKGPETVEDYVRLVREVLLGDVKEYIVADEEGWRRIGQAAVAGDVSGRGMENISRQIVTRIQNFEYPDEYFSADWERKRTIIGERSVRVDAAWVEECIDRYIGFEKEQEQRLARKRFDDAVAEAVFGLDVQREVFRRVRDAGEQDP